MTIRVKKKYYVVFIIITIIAVFETILRIQYSEELTFIDRPMVYKYDSIVNYTYIPDTIFKKGDKSYYINKQGFIGSDFEISTPDSFRIAIVGASPVSGTINMEYYYSFCLPFQKRFNENGHRVKVMNCGIDGGNRTLENFKTIQYKVLEFKPDMILLEFKLPFYTNNIIRECYKGYFLEYPTYNKETFEDGKRMVDNLIRYKVGIDILYKSFCIRRMTRIYRNYNRLQRRKYDASKDLLTRYIELYETKHCECIGKHKPIHYSMEESIEMVKVLRKDLEKEKIAFFLFHIGKEKEITSIAKNSEIPLISLGVSFDENDYFKKDGHWNESGCSKVADHFYTLLIKHKLIPENFINK